MLQFRRGLAIEAMQTDLLQREMMTKVASAHPTRTKMFGDFHN